MVNGKVWEVCSNWREARRTGDKHRFSSTFAFETNYVQVQPTKNGDTEGEDKNG